MPVAETAKTAAPRRGRTAAPKTTTAKAAPKAAPKVTPTDDVEETASADLTRFTMELEPHRDGDAKSYARFVPPAGTGCVGTLYVPLGTVKVKVLVIGETDTEE